MEGNRLTSSFVMCTVRGDYCLPWGLGTLIHNRGGRKGGRDGSGRRRRTKTATAGRNNSKDCARDIKMSTHSETRNRHLRFFNFWLIGLNNYQSYRLRRLSIWRFIFYRICGSKQRTTTCTRTSIHPGTSP